MKLSGQIVDPVKREIFSGTICVENGVIQNIIREEVEEQHYILPGFINAHVHIESSMLTPSAFAYAVVPHGTVAVVSDPHEIANVLGVRGIDFMIENAKKTPLKIYFGVPSCVPATPFEKSGAVIDAQLTDELLERNDLWFLSEMMNFPGVIHKDKEVMSKIDSALKRNKPVDGHAPFLTDEEIKSYCGSGITTDHECVDIAEARKKIQAGMFIQIREGSAAKNFEMLHHLILECPEKVMLCTDDSHPDDLEKGFINKLVKRALDYGHNLFDVLQAVSLNPIQHYNLPVGYLQKGQTADFITVDNLKDLNVLSTYIDGKCCFEQAKVNFEIPYSEPVNHFDCELPFVEDFKIPLMPDKAIKVMEVVDGDLITDYKLVKISDALEKTGYDLEQDILKIAVLNRYEKAKVQTAYITGFGIKEGAFAQSIAHDSHNIVAVGTNDNDLQQAVQTIIEAKGGVAFCNGQTKKHLELEIAGLMTNKKVQDVAHAYDDINVLIKQAGSPLHAPLMTASFMSLLVIPKLKLGDRGLFDVEQFDFTDLQE